MKCEETKELLTAMVDGEITSQEEERLSAHLKKCNVCSARLEEERTLKSRLRALYSDKRVNEELEEEIRKMINERTTTFPAVVVKQFPSTIFAGLGLALVFIIFLYFYFYPSFWTKRLPEKLMSYASGMIEKIQEVVPELEYSTSVPSLLEEYFRKHPDINFEVTVPDMRGAGYELLGGNIKKLNSIPVAISVYKSEEAILLNMMFEGIEFDGEEFGREIMDEKSGMEFYISAKGNLNSVAWWMGDELCIVVSTLPHEKLIEFIISSL